MKTRNAFIISLCATVLAYVSPIFLSYANDRGLIGDRFFLNLFSGLFYSLISLFIASFISGLLGIFTKKKSVSIWLFLGIFIAGIACSIVYFHWWSHPHFFPPY